MKKRIHYIALITSILVMTMLTMAGCKKNKENEDEASVTPTVTSTPTISPVPTEEVENHENEVRSKITGLWIPKENGNKRPYAIMLNNIKLASPQSGTKEAGILYEALVEGGITRLMGIYEDLNEKRIGSVRSARHYYVSIADEYEAIYVHFGETSYATKKIKELGIDNLSGLTGISDTVFFRDKSIKAPHNAFATKEGILKGTQTKGYSMEYSENYESHFKFYEKDTDLQSKELAEKVTLMFSNYASPYFTYDREKKQYNRFQYDKEHVDYNTGEQLVFKNIIVQFVKEWNIDKNGYQTMELENASGNGYYITNGLKIDITWKKNESTGKMRYYDAQGNELTMNAGKTYIALFPNDRTSDVVLAGNSQ
ncbi:hypothetical protein acsn021_29590 [Anaerocolumna cellulosilytica]|uniref:Uncharacterized protein n=1 Tax=Anaerocolumna cellulosilytica TaxID=433286 RepID=A0A6S6R7F5_9FIRM|nr:DUF3048 domain-containing protein [Anaerocolumna cellulosilytica]MBB5197177.1 hypothetical protein [Anaerocolumna cellulosilytica]BCJ95390.1 hypothetical protein acsn021_29590 [Anaerocolumna cellulosilytica]